MKNGRLVQDISVIGKIIAKMGLEYNFFKMETNMKACGQEIRDMDRVHIGEMKVGS